MKIVIDVPDALVKRFSDELVENRISKDVNEAILDAFCNGIALPKGHGRLGDLDALEQELVNGIKAGNYEEGYEQYGNINDVDDCVDCVKYADTIIEGDTDND